MNNKKYKTSEFAKMAGITERTIRYYDKIGLLKPSSILPNGYRQYDNQDFLKLQKILILKELGFSLDEVFPLIVNDENNLKESFVLQRDLISQRISQFQILNTALKSALALLEQELLDWNKIIELIHLSNKQSMIADQYKNAKNLDARIKLHNTFSTNSTGWFNWLFSNIDFNGVYRLLEVGCGNGALWDNREINLRNREMFLSDASSGMIDDVKKKLGNDFNCIVCECESIPFKNNFFDALVANHVLFYLKDINVGLAEIVRVLKPNGIFYCTTYGKNHMKEINELVQEFDSNIVLSETNLFNKFGLEDGQTILEDYFSEIKMLKYPDSLHINEVEPLIEYILSCHGNQNEIIAKQLSTFKLFLENKISEKGYIEITKDAGLFICKK